MNANSPVFPEGDHVVGAAGVVVEGALGEHELRVPFELPNIDRFPSFVIGGRWWEGCQKETGGGRQVRGCFR